MFPKLSDLLHVSGKHSQDMKFIFGSIGYNFPPSPHVFIFSTINTRPQDHIELKSFTA